MRAYKFWIGVFAATVAVGTARAEPEPTAAPIRLTVELSDGCRLIGVPAIASVPIVTALGKIAVPLAQATTMVFHDDHEGITVTLANGDRLTGVHGLGELRMKTLFGDIAIRSALIRKIDCLAASQAARLPADLRKGLVLYYSFDGNEGRNVTDQSDKKNHGKPQGVEWTPNGKAGGAYRFDGVNHAIVTTEPIGIAGAAANTVCAWTKSVNNENMKCIWSMGDGHGGGENAHGPALHGDFLGLHYGGIGDTLVTRVDPAAWNFVCRTYDGNTQFLYLNGVLIGEERRAMRLADHPLNIGRWKAGDDYSYYFNGIIDEVMVFDRALSKDDIKKLYDAQK